MNPILLGQVKLSEPILFEQPNPNWILTRLVQIKQNFSWRVQLSSCKTHRVQFVVDRLLLAVFLTMLCAVLSLLWWRYSLVISTMQMWLCLCQ